MDQTTGGGAWRSLGNLGFGTTARVTIRVVDLDSVSADAVRFVPGGGAPPPETVEPPTDGTTRPTRWNPRDRRPRRVRPHAGVGPSQLDDELPW